MTGMTGFAGIEILVNIIGAVGYDEHTEPVMHAARTRPPYMAAPDPRSGNLPIKEAVSCTPDVHTHVALSAPKKRTSRLHANTSCPVGEGMFVAALKENSTDKPSLAKATDVSFGARGSTALAF